MPVATSAGELLRDARRRAGLTQTALAERAGVTQSVVSVYESGRRQPSFPVLVDLIGATGHTLDLSLTPTADGGAVSRRPLSGPIGRRLRRHRREVRALAAAHGVHRVGVFGSVARGAEGPDSDVDLLVEMPAGASLFALGRLRRELEELLGATVDLVPDSGLKADVRPLVEADLVLL
jgi:uncharacterized protein